MSQYLPVINKLEGEVKSKNLRQFTSQIHGETFKSVIST